MRGQREPYRLLSISDLWDELHSRVVRSYSVCVKKTKTLWSSEKNTKTS